LSRKQLVSWNNNDDFGRQARKNGGLMGTAAYETKKPTIKPTNIPEYK
jgi:hypothetical protein